MPRLQWQIERDDWLLLGFDYVHGRHPDPEGVQYAGRALAVDGLDLGVVGIQAILLEAAVDDVYLPAVVAVVSLAALDFEAPDHEQPDAAGFGYAPVFEVRRVVGAADKGTTKGVSSNSPILVPSFSTIKSSKQPQKQRI